MTSDFVTDPKLFLLFNLPWTKDVHMYVTIISAMQSAMSMYVHTGMTRRAAQAETTMLYTDEELLVPVLAAGRGQKRESCHDSPDKTRRPFCTHTHEVGAECWARLEDCTAMGR